MLIRAKNLARRLLRNRVRAFLDRSGFPFLLPHFQVCDAGLSTLGGPPEPMAADLLTALRLCDGSRTLDQVARESGVARECLMEVEQAGRLIVWPYRPAPAGCNLGSGIILWPDS